MAERQILEMHPILPELDHLDPGRINLVYDDMTDTLLVHFFGVGRAAVSVEIGDGTFLRVDPLTQQVVGLQIESSLARESATYPEIIALAELAGAPASAIARARQRVSPSDTKLSALSILFSRPLLSRVGG